MAKKKGKTEIVSLSYNAMFKAIFHQNKYLFSLIVQAVLDYCNYKIDIKDKDLIIKNNELPINNVHDRQLICDYIIKLDDNIELNIEVNRTKYPGLFERNMTYSFKIYCEHFNAGDNYQKFSKYCLMQVNFNNFKNANEKTINQFLLLDVEDIGNSLSGNFRILNIDIASCFNLVYNNDKLDGVSKLERLSAILYPDNLEDISSIIRSDIMDDDKKQKLLEEIEEKSKDKDILEAVKLEDSIEYRFEAMRQAGIEEGIEKNTIQTIKSMLAENIDINIISKVLGKTPEEIEDISRM